ncbi:MAG: NUDIX domain-containing protein [Defluviicoccus sp.]
MSVPPSGAGAAPSGMTADDIEVLEQVPVFQGYFRVDRYRLRHRLFGGGWSAPFLREVFDRGHAVAVVLYDPERDALVLIEQFRVGALAAGQSSQVNTAIVPWLIEIVAGIIDEGETPEAVAAREAVEEAGCEIRDLFPVCHFVLTPGVSSETIWLFCGRVSAPASGCVHGLAHEHEDIRVLVVPSADAFRWLEEGRINNATALIGLQWFRLHHQEIRARWLGDASP